MTGTNMWVAQRVREAREEAGLTQAQLAKRVDKTQTAVSFWESGKRTPGLDDLIQLSDALKKDVYYFLPSTEMHMPVATMLRAVADRLASVELREAVERLLIDAEALGLPQRRFEIRSQMPAHAANELLEAAVIMQPPVDIQHLAELCGVQVLERPFPDALSGLVLEMRPGAIIGINSNHHANRKRFSMAHELGHHLLKHAERFHIDVNDGDLPGNDYQSERAANEFAAELLMPRRLVVPRFDANPDPPALAGEFVVSEIAMGYRLVNLGLR